MRAMRAMAVMAAAGLLGTGAIAQNEMAPAAQDATAKAPGKRGGGARTRVDVEAMAARQFAKMDANSDGTVTKEEADAGAAGTKRPKMGARWMTRADADKDGRVTAAEAKTQALAMFDRQDANKDGTLTPDERRLRGAAGAEAAE